MSDIPYYDEFKATPGNSLRGGLCFRCGKRAPVNRLRCWSKKCKEFVRALKKAHLCHINQKPILIMGAIPHTKVCEFAGVPQDSKVSWVTTQPGHNGDLKPGEYLGVCEPFTFIVEVKDEAVV